MKHCDWCRHPGAENEEAVNLCLDHEAEREGTSVDEYLRMEADEAYEASGR